MPNTLVHLAIQGPASRILATRDSIRWAFLGCVIPDLPWILQRFLRPIMSPGEALYDLRLYATVQSSLAFCVILSAAIASTARRPLRPFLILATNALAHLVLDGYQHKWGNGVHLFAPFSWKFSNFGIVWPESALSVLLTFAGLVYAAFVVATAPRPGWDHQPSRRAATLTIVLLAAYLAAPLGLMHAAEASDSHGVRTLRDRERRTGKPIALDRPQVVVERTGVFVETYAGERLRLEGNVPSESGTVSIRGEFANPDTIEVFDYHRHWSRVRNVASYLGLAAVVAVWIPHWRRSRKPRLRTSSGS